MPKTTLINNRRYLGNKYRLLPFITQVVNDHCQNVQVVADLFAGTGGIGIEFVSRGARQVTSVELAHTQQNFIISVCKQLGISNLRVVRGDVFKFINACHATYDFIYADPPYQLESRCMLPDLIFEKGLLKPDGWFVIEHSAEDDYSQHPHFYEHRAYGSVNFSFFR